MKNTAWEEITTAAKEHEWELVRRSPRTLKFRRGRWTLTVKFNGRGRLTAASAGLWRTFSQAQRLPKVVNYLENPRRNKPR